MKNFRFCLLLFVSACALHGCKPKDAYQYDKYGMQRMAGSHVWSAAFINNYHNGAIVYNVTDSLPDTSFIVSVLDKDVVEVFNTPLYIVNEYATSGTLTFINDTGAYCGPACRKITLNYNYNANTINVTDGIYNINSVDDTLHSYTAPGH